MVYHRSKLPIDDSRERRVTDDEIALVGEFSESEELPFIIDVAVASAMRRGEIAGLELSKMDFSIPSAKLVDTKNKNKTRIASLMPKAAAIPQGMPKRSDGRIFGMKDGSISKLSKGL